MTDLVDRALSAKRESKYIEFKSTFDPQKPGEWCELIKDIVAVGNSGGGIIVFGLSNSGLPTGSPIDPIAALDPADIANKIAKYTGPADLEFDILPLEKSGHKLVGFLIHPVSIPLVFQKPGTYDIGSGKQRTAFSNGTVYFRHGAKSEPGTSDDIRKVIERQLEHIRKSWLKGVRKVVQAPAGSQIVAVSLARRGNSSAVLATTVRAVNDPAATPVRLTRDRTFASGSFIHEEVSDGIFDEINNVVDANRALARGQRHFLLGQPVYYRIYAERHHVIQAEETLALLLHSALSDFYAPFVFWILSLPDSVVARALAPLYLCPKNPHIHALMRTAVLLGPDFSQWLYGQWHAKWKGHSQPPSFYWTFKEMIKKAEEVDYRIIAARSSATEHFGVGGETSVSVAELIEAPERAASMLSKACMSVFEGTTSGRTLARKLDYLAYGSQVRARSGEIVKSVLGVVGNRTAGDVVETNEVGSGSSGVTQLPAARDGAPRRA